ncbi:MAG: hypothetical protein A4E37_00461 [Methanoregulaceae archaeon PtaB.Bin056]|jgi:hypothetical protein|nr:MAG: hypothetical protein A4E37_00461 [Methanoregulaceae archaeon PtaB.Bin056]
MNIHIRELTDHAVSPVIGVMLMLIVVVIIAAVVSGFAGGLLGDQEKTPTLSMDVHIKNSGSWVGSYFSARVLSVERAIPTSDLKLATKWTIRNSTGAISSGGATCIPFQGNGIIHASPSQACSNRANYGFVAPLGMGPGLGDSGGSSGQTKMRYSDKQYMFGYYDLAVGTVMWAQPYGETARPSGGGMGTTSYTVGYGVNNTRYKYTEGTEEPSGCGEFYYPKVTTLPDIDLGIGKSTTSAPIAIIDANYATYGTIDPMTAVLGVGWEKLRVGDIVKVSLIHIPSGRTIWQKDVVVEG